jgi:isoleucyl-tRNA synthetase
MTNLCALCVSILQGLLSALAPLVPHMAEDAWLNQYSSSSSNGAAAAAAADSSSSSLSAASVFMSGWSKPDPQWSSMSQVS